MSRRIISTAISAAVLVVFAVAFAPMVATAFAHSRPTINEATLKQLIAEQSCAAFEVWFLDPACSKVRGKKAARAKHHLAYKGTERQNRLRLGALAERLRELANGKGSTQDPWRNPKKRRLNERDQWSWADWREASGSFHALPWTRPDYAVN